MTEPSAKKSTTVRVRKLAQATVRSTYRGLELVAPGVAAGALERRWFRLPAPPPAPTGPRTPRGSAFEVRTQGATVRGWRWGDGPAVYLVHGWGGRHQQLAGFVAPLVGSGFSVVGFDAPSHGDSDPGPSGPGSSNAVEFGRALDAVMARHGRAHAIVTHSMGGLSALLTLAHGWLDAGRVAMVAPMLDLEHHLDLMQRSLGFGARTRARLLVRARSRVGLAVEELRFDRLARQIDRPDLLVVHDRADREAPYDGVRTALPSWPGAELVSTSGLGHRRILRDPGVIDAVVRFVACDSAYRRRATA